MIAVALNLFRYYLKLSNPHIKILCCELKQLAMEASQS